MKRIFHESRQEEKQHETEAKASDRLSADKFNLKRFLEAQSVGYIQALREMNAGRKRSHWIWYIFPQMAGLGHSYNSRHYAISCREEAEAYLAHPILGERLRIITNALLAHNDMQAVEMLGDIDAIKVRSCMTLFDIISPNDIFKQTLDTFYEGKPDGTTLRLIEQ